MIDKTWVLTANSAVARFFFAETNEMLKPDIALTHPKSRVKEGENLSDSVGIQHSRMVPSRRPIAEPKVKKHEAEVFAKQICAVIEDLLTEGKLKNLYIAASPEFLGIIQNKLSLPAKKTLRKSIDKDLTHQDPENIRKHFPLVL